MHVAANEHHEWLKNRDWPEVQKSMVHPDLDINLLKKVLGEMSMFDCHIIGWRSDTHTCSCQCGRAVDWLESRGPHHTRQGRRQNSHDIANNSGACAEIIGLLSHTPEEARSLGCDEMRLLYAPVAYWWGEMVLWIKSRSWADCHKFIDEHDNELVHEVLKHYNSNLLLHVAQQSQVYSDSLMFLALRFE